MLCAGLKKCAQYEGVLICLGHPLIKRVIADKHGKLESELSISAKEISKFKAEKEALKKLKEGKKEEEQAP